LSTAIKIFNTGFRQVLRDGMLLLLIPAPFLMGAVLRLLLPFVDIILQQRLDFTLLSWYPLSDTLVLTLTPVMTAMICAFIILDERDVGISIYYNITPANGYSYLLARVAMPMIWGFISSILVISFFAFVINDLITIIIASFIGTLQGVIVCMLLVTLAGNKVEGLALAKLTNFFVMGFIVPWLIQSPVRYIFGLLPSFWIGEIVKNTNNEIYTIVIFSLAGLISCLLWIVVLTKMFIRRIN
jgi:fluoroquinolone transport system permease protein